MHHRIHHCLTRAAFRETVLSGLLDYSQVCAHDKRRLQVI